MLQQSIAALIVALAAAYALWYWLPAGLRRRLGRVQKKLGDKPGCGACSSCGGCAPAAQAEGAPDAKGRQSVWIRPRR